jgi:hypothetical protein
MIVFFLIASGVPYAFVQDYDHVLVESASGLIADRAFESETLWLDTYGPDIHVDYSQMKLSNSVTYTITIEGTWSGWPQNWWTEGVPPVGPVEEAPMYPSQGGGKVGADPYWGFAYPQGEAYARSIGAWPLPAKWLTIFITLDKEASWEEIRPFNDVYNPLHKYEIEVVGEGEVIGFCFDDTKTIDNCGMLKIVIEPQLNDADSDGLLDEWEKDGIDSDDDGDIDLVLEGANWQHKDIFVEVDYMVGHRPMDAAMEDVKVAFSRAPNALINNPDGKDGVNLHILVDDQITHLDVIYLWDEFDSMKNSFFGSFEQRTSDNRDEILQAKKMAYRYCMFINQFARFDNETTSFISSRASGMAELPGNDFIVSLGAFTPHGGTRDHQAATFMHELGHTLNLRHGGSENENYKPNYLSIMNYLFMFEDDPIPNRPLDYSRSALSTINETHLNELKGISPNAYEPSYYANWVTTAYSDASGQPIPSSLNLIDWSNDSSFDSNVSADINNFACWESPSGEKTPLIGYEDWSHLLYNFKGMAEYADGVHQPAMDEITSDILEMMSEYRFEVLPTPNPDGGGDNTLLYIGIGIVAVLAIAGVAVVMMRRRK